MTWPSPILLLTNQLTTGGAERYVVAVSSWLADQGVEVIVAASPGELVDALDSRVRYEPIELADLRWSIPLAAVRVGLLIRRYRPAAVVANSLVTAIVARLTDPLRERPLIAVAHGWPPDRYRPVGPGLMVADRVVAVSDDVRRRLVAAGLPSDRAVVIPNGVDLRPFGPRTRAQRETARAALGAREDDVAVVSVGRFVPQKAQHRIIALAQRLAPTHPHLRFALIGWGDLEGALRAQIAAAGLDDVVRLLIRRDDVPDLLLAADLYLSVSDWEGMPLSTIEAMAAGLPVVATSVEGMSTLLDDTVGVLCPPVHQPADLEPLAAALAQLADDEPLRLTKGSHARARAGTDYGLDVMARRLAELLRRMVDGV